MRIFFTSLLSAVLGALLVYGAFTLAPPAVRDASTQIVDVGRPVDKTPSAAVELSAQEIYERHGDAVVHIKASVTQTYENFFGLPVPENQISSGSGFIVSGDGYVITNAHVVSGADKVVIQFSDQAEEEASVVGIDPSTDLAVLKADLKNHKTDVLDLGNPDTLKVGQTVYAIGNPLGYDRSMSSGIVSALNRVINAPNGLEIRGVIQTDAAVNRGNSGGPLLSARGKVMGVTSQIASTTDGNIGIAFAIPSSTVKRVFEEIRETGKTSRPWLGIQGRTLSADLAKALELKIDAGAMIVSVMDSGPARDAGLRGASAANLGFGTDNPPADGDIITKLNKTAIKSMEDLVNETNQYRAGEKVRITYLRDGKLKTVTVVLAERPAQFDEINLRGR